MVLELGGFLEWGLSIFRIFQCRETCGITAGITSEVGAPGELGLGRFGGCPRRSTPEPTSVALPSADCKDLIAALTHFHFTSLEQLLFLILSPARQSSKFLVCFLNVGGSHIFQFILLLTEPFQKQ